MSSPPPGSHHHRRVTTSEEDADEDPLVAQTGCGKKYARLEECLAENDRDWRKCQEEVKDLRICFSKNKGTLPRPPYCTSY